MSFAELEGWLLGSTEHGHRRSASLEGNCCELAEYPFGTIAKGYALTLEGAVDQALAVAHAWFLTRKQ